MPKHLSKLSFLVWGAALVIGAMGAHFLFILGIAGVLGARALFPDERMTTTELTITYLVYSAIQLVPITILFFVGRLFSGFF